MDPPRKLVAWLVSGQLRASLGYLPLLPGSTPVDVSAGQQVLDDGLAILQRLETTTRPPNSAADYADTVWRMTELLNTKASLAALARDAERARTWRKDALVQGITVFCTCPLDADRVWQSFSIWPEIPPAQRLSLLRGMLPRRGGGGTSATAGSRRVCSLGAAAAATRPTCGSNSASRRGTSTTLSWSWDIHIRFCARPTGNAGCACARRGAPGGGAHGRPGRTGPGSRRTGDGRPAI